jgi:hypothetical protein
LSREAACFRFLQTNQTAGKGGQKINKSYLKIRIFGRDQDKTEDQPAGILKYVEDLRRRLNADIGRKELFEMAYSFRMIKDTGFFYWILSSQIDI